MSHEQIDVLYAGGELARVGDIVVNDTWESIVVDVIKSPEDMAFWGLSEPGLMLKCKEAGLVFEPCSSVAWESIVCTGRAS